MIDYNPFKGQSVAESDKMKALFKKLREVNAEICLQYAEEYGEKLNMDHVHRSLHALTDYDVVMFKIYAASYLNTQPETSLDINERIAIAAHEAYKKVKDLG